MKRILILISVASIVISLFAVTAFGATTNENENLIYTDFIDYVYVDGERDIVSLSFPASMCTWFLFDSEWNKISTLTGKYVFDFNNPATDGGDFHLEFIPLGGRYLSLEELPNDATFSFLFTLTGFDDEGSGEDINFTRLFLDYKDEKGNATRDTSYLTPAFVDDGDIYEYRAMDLTFRADKIAVSPTIDFYFHSDYDDHFYAEMYSFTLDVSIDSFYLTMESLGYGEKLDSIKGSLEDFNGKIDITNDLLGDISEALNGKVTPEAPEGSDTIQGTLDAENELKDKLNTDLALDEFQDAIHSVNNYLIHYGQGFYFLIVLMEAFINIFWIKGLIMISISLGLFAFVTNVIQNIGSRAGKDKSNKRKGGRSG